MPGRTVHQQHRYALVGGGARGSSAPLSQPAKCRQNCVLRPGLLYRSRCLIYYSAWLGCTMLVVTLCVLSSTVHYEALHTERLRSLIATNSAIIAKARSQAREPASAEGKQINDIATLREAVNAGIDVDRAIASATRAVAGATSVDVARPVVEEERSLVEEKAAMEAAAQLAAQSVEAGSAHSAAVHNLGAALGALGAEQENLAREAEEDAERAAALPGGSDPDKASLRAGVELKLGDVERIGDEQRAIVEKIASVALEGS